MKPIVNSVFKVPCNILNLLGRTYPDIFKKPFLAVFDIHGQRPDIGRTCFKSLNLKQMTKAGHRPDMF